MAGYFHLAAGKIECKLKKTPEIQVSASDTRIRYDHSKTQSQMDNMQTDTVSPYGENVQSHVGGLMSGEVRISQNIRIMQETYPAMNTGCLYVDSLQVNIHINPTIYIAKEFKKSGCMYKAIMEHEKKHIKVDRDIVNKYTTILVQGLNSSFKKVGYAHGPYSMGHLPTVQKKLQDYSQDLVRKYSDQMSEERRVLQQQVDSLQEYERVRRLCEGKD